MKFSAITGQKDTITRLIESVRQGRVSHAQLFTGRSGYGVLPLALAYAQYLNCTDRRGDDSCGECPSCRKIEELAHPDVHFVFPVNSSKSGSQKPLSDSFIGQWRRLWSETGGVFDEQMWYRAINIENQQGLITRNEADEIIRKLSFKSFEARYKVMIIWLPEKMRTEAANTLLKILEEPWENTVFIMVSEAAGKLLPTIISRTQEIAVPAPDVESVEEYIARNFPSQAAEAADIARLSGGDLIEVRRLLSGEGTDTQKEFFELFASLMRFSYNDRHMELLEWAEAAASLGRENQKKFLQYSVRLLRECFMMSAGMTGITYLWGAELEFCKKFSPFIGNHNIENLVTEMEKAGAEIAQNGNARIIFSHFALTVSKMINPIR